jgi:hypothetical protein
MKTSTWVVGALVAAGIISMALSHSDKPPCSTLTPIPTYYYDLGAYRQHEIQDAIDDVQEHGGDKFDQQAAVQRVAAVSDEELDKQRRSELAFATKTL